ncbi:helix-turn-helix domain-containing protein [Candidatus Pacearchaeota archaeon]|nr:helix-turn-helix domain-containing protein [Candidatus Pacearchaeota archaeon]
MDQIKDAFKKVKEDIDFLMLELSSINSELSSIMGEISQIKDFLDSTQNSKNPASPTHIPTHRQSFKPFKTKNIGISIGNEGVPTDRQTNQQTDRHIKNTNIIDSAAEILDSLDSVKKEIRLKFKRLTDQEFLIFSTLYKLDEEIGFVDYKTISTELGLTESSIRDYIGKLIKKGIPIEKQRINNKNIRLSIAQNLKKVTTLQTILQLRDL